MNTHRRNVIAGEIDVRSYAGSQQERVIILLVSWCAINAAISYRIPIRVHFVIASVH